MKELEQIGEAFEAEIVKQDLTELAGDLSDTLRQQLGEDIPVFGVFFKAIKAIGAIKDLALISKVYAFMGEVGKMSTKQRKSLVKKINKDRVYGQRFGAYLISAIDRHEFSQKSVYLARACKYFERGDISRWALIKLNTIIQNVHLQDIQEFMEIDYTRIPKIDKDPAFNSFLANGIIRQTYDFEELRGPQVDNNRMIRPIRIDRIIRIDLTDLGSALYAIVKDKELLWHTKDELTRK